MAHSRKNDRLVIMYKIAKENVAISCKNRPNYKPSLRQS